MRRFSRSDRRADGRERIGDGRVRQRLESGGTSVDAAAGTGYAMAIEFRASRLPFASRRALRSALLLPGVDTLVMLLAFALGGLINLSYHNWDLERSLILVVLVVACLTAFHQLGHYSRRRPFWPEVGDIVVVGLLAVVADAALLYLLKVNFSRLWVVTSWAGIIVALPLVRILTKRVSSRLGAWRQPTVVVGTGRTALEAAEALACDNHLGFEIVAFIDPSAAGDGPALLELDGRDVPVEPIEPGALALPAWLGQPHVVIALELDEMAGREALIENLSLRYGDLDIVTPLRGLPINRARVTHFLSQDVLSLRIYNSLARPWSQALKRLFDVVVGSLLLVAAAPLMAVIAWQVRKSGGPILFAHERVGRHGQLFRCLKFRTMVPEAASVLARLLAESPEARAEWDRDFKLRSDPRVTPIGRWLRQTSLDELPQLINVLKGEMSLVGPRPVVRDELRRYGEAQVYYTQVRPGLTGLWQISGRNDVDYERRIHLDAWYVRNWNLWYDVVILAKTFLIVLTRSGAY
jgi:undecaprenyl-phosphate galactose phosphotransferase